MNWRRNDNEEENKKNKGPQWKEKGITNLESTAAGEYSGWGSKNFEETAANAE